MATRVQQEIRQERPFDTARQEAYVGVLRTAAVLEHRVAEALRQYRLTPTQYNVLRILRGAGADGLCRNAVRDRMIARVPDATRLLDRMEASGLIRRERDMADRRFVKTQITGKGLDLLAELDRPMLELHERQFGPLNDDEVRTLTGLLDRVRSPG